MIVVSAHAEEHGAAIFSPTFDVHVAALAYGKGPGWPYFMKFFSIVITVEYVVFAF